MTNFAARQGYTFKRANKVSKNRVVLAPLTHNMSQENGDLSSQEIDWLAQCAAGGFGTIITAATLVAQSGRSWQGQPALNDDRQIAQFQQIAAASSKHGALSIVQLHHGGIRAEPCLSGVLPVAPSEYLPDEFRPAGARALAQDEIEALIQSFVNAAQRAHRAGLDGVEIHAAFNFILSSFLNPLLNRRTDGWGGDGHNRGKILFEIVTRIRRQLPREFLVGVRLSPENYAHFKGINIEEQLALCNQLAKLDIDYIHMSLHDVFKTPNHLPESGQSLLRWIKRRLDPALPLIVAGKVSTVRDADKALALGGDLVAIGTAAIGNPDWVKRSNAGMPLIKAPYSKQHLGGLGFTPRSIDYLSSINGLVAA